MVINSDGRVIELNLSGNNLNGKLPLQLKNLTALTKLDLSNNKIGFELDIVDFSAMTDLQYLYLNDNNFTGSVPASLGQASALKEINLSHNQLSGTLTLDDNYQTLESADFSHNMIEKLVMDGNPEIPNLWQLLVDHNCISDFTLTNAIGFTYMSVFYINDNKLTALPDLGGFYDNGMYDFNCSNNYQDFGDLENGNVQTQNDDFTHNIYYPQYKTNDVEYYNPDPGTSLTLSVSVGGNDNSYEWYRNGLHTNTHSSTFNISNYDSALQAGVYYCEITNSLFTDLTLHSNNKFVDTDTPFYNITISVNPSSAAEFFTGDGSYYEGQEATLKVKPKPAWHFLGWKINGEFVSPDTAITLTVFNDISATACFISKSFIASVEAEPLNAGTVTGGGLYQYGETVHLSATPSENCSFVQWNEYDKNGQIINTTTDQSFDLVITHDIYWKAQFQCTATAICDVESDKIQIYPNPASDFINISVEGQLPETIEIVNLIGQKQNIEIRKIQTNLLHINLKNLSPGIYLIYFKTDTGKLLIKKFVVR